MPHFINLSTRVINKLHIVEIVKHPSKYYIYTLNTCVDGFMVLGTGYADTNRNVIEICKDTPDWTKIANWIETL